MSLLDPGPVAEAGAIHGQLASSLPGGGLSLSCHKLVEDAARCTVLLAPGLFRLDVRPIEDTLQVMTRSLHAATPARWDVVADGEVKGYAYGEPYRLEWAVELPFAPRPIRGRVMLSMTADAAAGVAHFVALAVLREATA